MGLIFDSGVSPKIYIYIYTHTHTKIDGKLQYFWIVWITLLF